ncbi:MAG: hypothetical protein H0Z22_08080 [Thermosipho sp. (in: Bacteria)]|nr:hypothetical protein [Thermosipho sp. (in: thermotogales)]
MKKMFVILILTFSILTFSSNFSYSVGIALSGALFPYVGIYYNLDNFQIGSSLGFICGPNDKNPDEWNFMFSPELSLGYFITKQLFVGVDFRMIVVVPYQYEQLYLSGIELKYGIPVKENKINLSLSGNLILPFSAGERAWEKDRDMNPLIPIPFIKGEFEF